MINSRLEFQVQRLLMMIKKLMDNLAMMKSSAINNLKSQACRAKNNLRMNNSHKIPHKN